MPLPQTPDDQLRDVIALTMYHYGRGYPHRYYRGALDRIYALAKSAGGDKSAVIDAIREALEDEIIPLFRPRRFELIFRRRRRFNLAIRP